MQDLKKLILDDITKTGKEGGLFSFEQVMWLVCVCVCVSACVCVYFIIVQANAIMLCSEPFSVENGLLSPTFKLKRVALKNRFMETFVKLYSQLHS